jgi:hypothetical protein
MKTTNIQNNAQADGALVVSNPPALRQPTALEQKRPGLFHRFDDAKPFENL